MLAIAKLFLYLIIILCIFYLTYFQNHAESKTIYFVTLGILIICIHINFSHSQLLEGMTSDEAIKNVASVFNTDNMVVKNLQITGDLKVAGGVSAKNLSASENISTKGLSVSDKVLGDLNIDGNVNLPKSGSTVKLGSSYIKGNTVGNYGNMEFWLGGGASMPVFRCGLPDGTIAYDAYFSNWIDVPAIRTKGRANLGGWGLQGDATGSRFDLIGNGKNFTWFNDGNYMSGDHTCCR